MAQNRLQRFLAARLPQKLNSGRFRTLGTTPVVYHPDPPPLGGPGWDPLAQGPGGGRVPRGYPKVIYGGFKMAQNRLQTIFGC